MSQATELLRFLRDSPEIMRRVRQEAPHAIPFLEAMAADDPLKASEIFFSYGDVRDILDGLPPDVRTAVEVAAPSFMVMVDAFLPEEALLRLLGLFGVKGG